METNIQGSVLVDVVIAVHTADRPIERAVASLMNAGLPTATDFNGRLRVTVVCHNTAIEPIRARVSPKHRDEVRFVQLLDGIGSPAGPFNQGIALAGAPWVAIMGSDDSLEPDALARWVEAAEADQLDVLLAPMAHFEGATIHTPVVRRTRRTALDPVADRLTYRTAPLGLMRLETIRRLGLEFPTKYATGEDQSFSARLWFSGSTIGYGRGLPRYLVHDDATVRVTSTQRSVTEDLAFATDLVQSEWFAGLTDPQRASIVTKLIRVHVFSHTMMRAVSGTWGTLDAAHMADVVRTLLFAAPRAIRPLSGADRDVLDAILHVEIDPAVMKRLTTRRRKFTNPHTWMPRNISQWLHPEAPIRFMSASALVR
ncbi:MULTISPECIES: glycosyltransferase family 2 protein [Arthrobacter]|uniref:glycosyltransferase family 2 protein n=1 Tax=Arthrobacter TaxID=1663 RepID=UPI003395DD41